MYIHWKKQTTWKFPPCSTWHFTACFRKLRDTCQKVVIMVFENGKWYAWFSIIRQGQNCKSIFKIFPNDPIRQMTIMIHNEQTHIPVYITKFMISQYIYLAVLQLKCLICLGTFTAVASGAVKIPIRSAQTVVFSHS